MPPPTPQCGTSAVAQPAGARQPYPDPQLNNAYGEGPTSGMLRKLLCHPFLGLLDCLGLGACSGELD